ncbi:hypothetical protein [Streptomyces stackebrandtii]|uniref:hypothetical protein n=1 Tax=Streptomyces stackebrandtii TaxID=3051177 RepID=UPI0028DBDDAA|nr:hypothetical protein [Streptomyces sp. DSM 40976]
MYPEKAERRPDPEGCLTAAIRIPVRIVVLIVVVPVRLVWDALALCGGFLGRVLLRPLGRAFDWFHEHVLAPVGRGIARMAEAVATAAWWLCKAVFYWPWLGLWRYVVVPLAVHLIAAPAAWLYRTVLTPLGRGLARGAAWLYARLLAPLGRGTRLALWAALVWPWTALWRYVVVPLASGAYRYVLTPLGHGLAWIGRGLVWLGKGIAAGLMWVGKGLSIGLMWLGKVLVVIPAVFLYRWVLAPVGRVLAVIGREIGDALAVAWRVAGYLSLAVGRALKWLAWNLLGRPLRWFYRDVCTPVGHVVRDALWRPAKEAAVETGRAVRAALASARETVRRARREAWHALVGGERRPEPVNAIRGQARNLGGAAPQQTLPGMVAEAEISLRKRG